MRKNFQYDSSKIKADTALLVTIKFPDVSEKEARAHLEELKKLTQTMGIKTAGTLIASVKLPKSRYLTGSGKANEICSKADELGAEIIIFDDDITPAQQRNWEALSKLYVIDRREVILEIFAKRASTKEAVLQVALARMEYSLPRLTRAWTHLSRQKGGARGTRGEGETQLEVDRRIVLQKITRLKKELEKVEKHRTSMRKKREGIPIPMGAIVGYTNAGKSSFLNMLTNAGSYVEDKLFATLDPLVKKVTLPGGREILLTDTVGFIRKLPHNLVDAFKSTLEEASLADFLVHILDISDDEFEDHYKTTTSVLRDLGAAEKPTILIFNKIDLLTEPDFIESVRKEYPGSVFVSSKTGEGEMELLKKVASVVRDTDRTESFIIPLDRHDLISIIHRKGKIIEEKYDSKSIKIDAVISAKTAGQINKSLKEV